MRTLDRLYEYDPRNLDYPVRTLVGSLPIFTKMWDLQTWLDQGYEGACVGFSWGHDIAAEPVVSEVTNDYARYLYNLFKTLDQWPGEDYDGTSVLAGAKGMLQLGWIGEYRWAENVQDAIQAICNIGPVILGTNWYTGMFDTDAQGYIHPTGVVEGGHAILIVGYDFERDAVLLHNSWGRSWGQDGRAWLKVEDLERLMAEDGEICVPLVRAIAGDDPVDPIEPIEPPVDNRNWFQKFLDWLWGLLWPF